MMTSTSSFSVKSSVAAVSAAMMLVMSLSGCQKPANDTETTVEQSTDPVTQVEGDTADVGTTINNDGGAITLYSARKEQLIQPLLDKFTEETGIEVELVSDKAGPLMERIKAEGENTPADVFLTVDAGNLWQASNEGVLQPTQSDILEANVPDYLQDPDNRWYGLSIRARTIFFDPRVVDKADLSTYADLANPKWKGKLCLRTSKKVYNQSLVAMLIEHYGEAKAEEIVRGWVDNLATDVFSNDTSMLEAIAAGQCQVGIANSYYYGRILEDNPDFPVEIFWADQAGNGTHVNVSGAGVVKGASDPDKALTLIEWLSQPEAQSMYGIKDKEYPVNDQVELPEMLQSWGTFKQDTINVAKAGSGQAQAVQLMDRAGYK